MSRYVDIETINPKQYENSEVELGYLAYDYDEVDAMPFLDIVRCKECKYWIDNCDEDDDLFRECRWREEEYMKADDFCPYGVRKGADDE